MCGVGKESFRKGDAGQGPTGDPRVQAARSRAELHQAALELMKKKHRDMGFIKDVIR